MRIRTATPDDAEEIAAVRDRGRKTNTPASALLGDTWNDLRDDCRNPHDPRLTHGGSSGGSAAAALCRPTGPAPSRPRRPSSPGTLRSQGAIHAAC